MWHDASLILYISGLQRASYWGWNVRHLHVLYPYIVCAFLL